MTRVQRLSVGAVVFFGGALLMALEILAFRIVGKTFGSALRETTAVIAVFLAAMSLGYWAGGRAGDRWPHTGTLLAVLLAAAATLLGVPWIDAAVSPLIAVSGLALSLHAFLATTILFAVPTVLFASISPIAVRLFATTTRHSGTTAGSISAISTFGSIAGSIATAFFLIDWLESVSRTVVLIALLSCATAAVLFASTLTGDGAPRSRRLVIPFCLVLAMLVIPGIAFMRSGSLDRSLLATPFGWRVLYVADSPYHRVIVREREGVVRTLTFGGATQSAMSLRDPFGAGAAYTDSFHIPRLLRPSVRRVLIIGLGGGTAAKQFVHDYPDVVVDAVEVDPLVVSVAMRYFFVEQSQRLRIHMGDGRTFLKHSPRKWDLVIIDAYTTTRYGDTIPPHLVTREFFAEVAAHLEEGGILQFHCAFGRSKLLPALQKTIAGTFDSVLVTGGEIIASDVPLIIDDAVLSERARTSTAARFPSFAGYVAQLRHVPRIPAEIPELRDDYAPVDLLLREVDAESSR